MCVCVCVCVCVCAENSFSHLGNRINDCVERTTALGQQRNHVGRVEFTVTVRYADNLPAFGGPDFLFCLEHNCNGLIKSHLSVTDLRECEILSGT